ncbi:urease subunit alpha [Pseudonocardia acaciae]|uniref:urease subunit alpha n=1 Tax=Pseudonocardia acaciae TaxID=551276 RepID=UPI00048F387C|nr:urease subunit alpha [Pseudonocardia acaciae]
MAVELPRDEYGLRYGPTTGDLVRLGDTNLWVRVEDDHVGYGDEPIWGYAKNLRSRMAQHDNATSASELDVLVAGVLLIDPLLGVVKTNIGVKDGRVVGIGRAGNPDVLSGVELVVGPNTMPIMGYGLVATAGGVDSHVHLMSPRLLPVALGAGVTTLVTAGFEEPPAAMSATLRAFEHLPVNIGLQASSRSEVAGATERVVEAGAIGLKIHEDWGAYPEIIDATLRLADQHDVAVALHTDGLHESAELEDTVEAIAGRAVHAYHVEGAGGHVPDLIALVREPNIICSSTTPTIPYGSLAPVEGTPMVLRVHGGCADAPEDLELAAERIHPATMAAEGPLHDLGAISIINSDSQGMGRIGETIRRTWQLAHLMKAWRATEAGRGWPTPPRCPRPYAPAGADDNDRVLRYLAKYTVEAAHTHGIGHEVGSLAPGRLADVVLWRPSHFGVRPELVLKAGYPAWGAIGEGNASVTAVEPRRYGPHWGGHGLAPAALSVTFVSQAAMAAGIQRRLGSRRRFVTVRDTRTVRRDHLTANPATAPIAVDPLDGTVTLHDRLLAAPPTTHVPLNRNYLLG